MRRPKSLNIRTPPTLEDYDYRFGRRMREVYGSRDVGPSRKTRRAAEAPLVSVVTVTLNSATKLPRAMESVRSQDYPNIECIVIDGGSQDSTVDVIRANVDIIDFWISEPDDGISDAFNKGVYLSHGEYIAILNSDDWLSPDQISRAARGLSDGKAGWVYGDLVYHGEDGSALYLARGQAEYTSTICYRMPTLNHPTVVVRREVYERVGLFNPSLRYAMDYDLLLRMHLAGYIGRYMPDLVGHQSLGGLSDRRYFAALRECRKIAVAHGAGVPRAWATYLWRSFRGAVRMGLECAKLTRAARALHSIANRNVKHLNRDRDGR